MGIILKYLLRNIAEKKFRTIIAVLSIAISAALLFASTSVTDTVVKMFTDNAKRYTGSADVVVRGDELSPSPFFLTKDVQSSRIDYQIPALEAVGQYEDVKNDDNILFKTIGMSVDDMQKMNPFALAQEGALQPFDGRKAIISQSRADKLGLALGDKLPLLFDGKREEFTIAGLAASTGIFNEFGTDAFVLVPPASLRGMYGLQDGEVNAAYIKARAGEDVQKLIADLGADYDGYKVREAISLEDIQGQVGTISSLFLMLTLIITMMSVFIIYSSFKVITVERINVMGVFRSIGATKRTTGMILMAESLLYGIVGGLVGCGLGIGILYGMSAIANSSIVKGAGVAIEFSPLQLAAAFALAVVLSLLSSLLPIMKASKVPLKEIIIGKFENVQPRRKSPLLKVFGVLLLPLGVVIPMFAPVEYAVPLDLMSLVLLVIGILTLVPVITPVFGALFEKLTKPFFGNEGILAAKNLRGNKSVTNNISLLGVAIAILLMINTVISGIVSDLTDFYTRTVKFDIMTTAQNMDAEFERKLQGIDGVAETYAVYAASNIEVVGKPVEIGLIEGADAAKYNAYWDIYMYEDSAKLVQELGDGRNILLNKTYEDKLGVRKGDIIKLKMKAGEVEYKVTGFLNTRMNESRYAVVAPQYLKEDMQLNLFSSIYVKTSKEPKDVAKDIRVTLKEQTPLANPMKEIGDNDIANNSQLFLILQAFLVLAIAVGVLSIMNNLLISFMERKRSLAMFRSVGMSRKQMVKMIFVEALTSGTVGGLVGLVGGVAMASIMPYVVDALGKHIIVEYSPWVLLGSFAAGVLVTLAASISPALKSSKLNIIESVRMD